MGNFVSVSLRMKGQEVERKSNKQDITYVFKWKILLSRLLQAIAMILTCYIQLRTGIL